MELVMYKNRSFFPSENSSSELSMVLSGLPESIDDLKYLHSRDKKEINSITLLEAPAKRMVLTVLQDGTEVYSFQSNDSATFQVIEGSLKIRTRRHTEILQEGQSLALYEKVEYILSAMGEATFLLTISGENADRQLSDFSKG